MKPSPKFNAILGIPIGALFAGIEHEITTMKNETDRVRGQRLYEMRKNTSERMARSRNIDRMRDITKAQLGMALAEKGVPYGYYGGGGSDGGPLMAAYVARAGGQ